MAAKYRLWLVCLISFHNCNLFGNDIDYAAIVEGVMRSQVKYSKIQGFEKKESISVWNFLIFILEQ